MSALSDGHSGNETDLRALLSQVIGQDVTCMGLDDDLVEAFGLDSLDALRLLAAAEKRYAFRFDDEQLSEVRTLRQILNAVEGEGTAVRPGDLG